MYNDSGMHKVAASLVAAESAIGLDSNIATPFDTQRDALIDQHRDADIHVSHTYFPRWMAAEAKRGHRVVWVGHGTPEHVFFSSLAESQVTKGAHGINDGFMLQQYYLQHSDHVVTFWERHAAIYRTMVDRRTPVHVVPLGVEKDVWKPVPSVGRWVGAPSLLSAENCHDIKAPYDLFVAWGLLYPRLTSEACLHVIKLPNDQHRYYFPLVNRNGSSFACHISASTYAFDGLRNAFCSVDYYIGLVRRGDFNRTCLEASACGTKTISYRGNQYADFWVTDGDQRVIADELFEILTGQTQPREKLPVPDILETAKGMKGVYEQS
jgi:hypothetical protein